MSVEESRRKRSQKKDGHNDTFRPLVTLYDNKNEVQTTDSSDCQNNKSGVNRGNDDEITNKTKLTVSLPAREIIMLFQCVRCKDTPLSPPVHICPAGHQSCHQCYTSCNVECVFCHQSFVGRNETLEMVIQNMHPKTALKLSYFNMDDNPPEDDIEQYDPVLLAKLERAHYESIRNAKLANESSGTNSKKTQTEPVRTFSEPSTEQSTLTVDVPLRTDTSTCVDIFKVPPLQSYVPVQCPVQSCGGVVTGSAFISHFEFEHLTVPIIAADYNAPNCKIAVNPSAFTDSNVQCLAIFLVPNEVPVSPSIMKIITDSEESIMGQIQLRKRSVLCLVLASKFTYVPVNNNGSDGDSGETFFLAWIACLYEKPPFYYTIEAVNCKEKLHTIKYCGPIGTLHESQSPNEVFRRGNCLVVTPGLLKRLSTPSGNIDISVLFHPVSVQV